MKTLDEFAAMAVADVRDEAARISDTEAALFDVHGEVQLVAAAPTGKAVAGGNRRRLLMLGAAAACVAAVVAAVVVGRGDQAVGPAESLPATGPATSTNGGAVPSMSSPLWDEETGSEIVLQFTRQWQECPPEAYCSDPRAHFIAPMVTSRGQIILGEASSPRWLVVEDGSITAVPFDVSWALRDAAMAPDGTVYAVFVVGPDFRAGYEVHLYRYVGADMSSPELIGEPHPWDSEAAVVLDVGGTSGAERIDFADGVFTVHRPLFLAQPRVMPAHGGGHNLLVNFGDGTSQDYELVSPGIDDNALVEASLHPLANSVVVIYGSAELPDAHQFLTVLLPDGSMRQRLLPFMQDVAVNDQIFVNEGYYYLLTAEFTTASTSTTAVYSVRRFALPTADDPPVVVPTATASSTTEQAGASSQVVVSGNAIADVQFGTSVDDSLQRLIAKLGEPGSDESVEYTRNADGAWTSRSGSFEHRFMRQVCWGAVAITCAVFGGDSADQLRLVGWRASAGPNQASPVYTAAGLRLGSVAADFGIEVTALQGEVCLGIGYGVATDGVRIDTFVLGTEKSATPDPASVVVVGMSAGELPTPSGLDC